MSAFCPSPLHPRCVALATCGISPVVHCFALSAVCGPFTANQPPFTLPTSGKPQISLYILLILVSFAGFRCPLWKQTVFGSHGVRAVPPLTPLSRLASCSRFGATPTQVSLEQVLCLLR
ncbi:hypothetical protein B0H10DRAFT_2126462, partial [Mycena sp. CBHHK59/15]